MAAIGNSRIAAPVGHDGAIRLEDRISTEVLGKGCHTARYVALREY